ncbi:hypothetical protein [Methylobacterium sp. Gmos1]
MASSTVSLGGIVLRGHEVPSKIPFGGKQRIAKNVLIGGQRVPDAMGPEECDAAWEGRFRGADAKSRALTIDAMRKNGAQIPLSWGGLYRVVLIEEFEADYRREFDIPYRIVCYVVDDGSGVAQDALGDIGSLIGADLSALGDLISGAIDSFSAVADLASAVGGIPSLAAAASVAITPIQDLSARAVDAVDAAVTAADAGLAAALIPDPVMPPGPALALALDATRDGLDTLSTATAVRGLVGRIDANLSTLAG